MRFYLGKIKIFKIIYKLILFIVYKERIKFLKKKLLVKKFFRLNICFSICILYLYIIICILLIYIKYLKFNDLYYILSKLVIYE